MLLMIDNYDSFTYNLVQYFGQLQVEVKVFRNDCLTIEEIKQLAPTHIVISPGPGTPDQAGISLAVIQHLAGHIPILGVCLGHQAIGQFFGGRVVQADRLMHGKTSSIYHDQKTIFRHLPSPFTATRYHSLIVEKESLPNSLIISARTEEGEIMALRHGELPVEGVQFHPESILTEHGLEILKNFLNLSTFHSPRSNEL
ncbi:MAG TPA: anthranilate/aminodeoxychorismate synthase component II [Desulfotomaculum sp.]|nr:anthranilate/aminodeoxychorismate synthase component II [Desulfotomaculum sp.]